MKKVAIIMGSDSDMPVAKKAVDELSALGIPYEVHVFSAHRTPEKVKDFSQSAREKGFGAIISFAGMAAHLGGVIASYTTLPVIGVPCESGSFKGMDALLATVQMPSGIPVATVAVNGGRNAAILAAEMIAIEDDSVRALIEERRKADSEKVLEKDRNIQAAL